MSAATVFLLSPARCDGKRAAMVTSPRAEFELAVRLRAGGAPIGELFAFMSGLYFRGKLAYARRFGAGVDPSVLVITTDRGLVPHDTIVTHADIGAFSRVDLSAGDARYHAPLDRDARRLRDQLPADARVVLLGSIATGKYVDRLTDVFGTRLVFPSAFVGRGDMSRGGLLLRQVESGVELAYEPVLGAVRHGGRPAKLEPKRRPALR